MAGDLHNAKENYSPTPYAERASQHVTFGDFLKRALFKIAVGATSGSAIGYAVTKIRNAPHHYYTQVGGFIGTAVGSYFTWRREEASKLEVDQVLKDYKELPGFLRTNEDVAQDNAVLKKIVAHQQEQLGESPSAHVAGSQHAGHAHARGAALQV